MAIRGIIWDLDNTLYRHERALAEAGELAAARTAIEMGMDIPLTEALSIARESYARHKAHPALFILAHGLNLRDFHSRFHTHLDEKQFVSRTWHMQDLMDNNIRNLLLTHATKDWAMRVLTHLHIKEHFPDSHILGLEDVDYTFKHASADPFHRALGLLDCLANEVAVVEDSPDNLRHPHDLGMTTVFIHHGKALPDLPSHIQYQYSSPVELLELLAISATLPPPVSSSRVGPN